MSEHAPEKGFMKKIPIYPSHSSMVIRELITRLKISDAMSTNLITAHPRQSLREIQHIMKEYKVSGLPVVEDRRIVGIISVDDIIRALDEGYIEDTAGQHMTRSLIILEENMPMSLAISHFERYSFGRFPVVNRNEELVGIITSRDILSKLLYEINQEVNKLEGMIPQIVPSEIDFFHKEYTVRKYDMENAGKISSEIKKNCMEWGLTPQLCRRIAIACYELEINLVVHSEGGSLTCKRDDESFTVIARDVGPGIADVDLALTEGWSTANQWVKSFGFGAGMGLPNVKRVSDDFQISSELGHGTLVTATVYLPRKGPAT